LKTDIKLKRILIKISGEALAGNKEPPFNDAAIRRTARRIAKLHAMGVEVAIVVGGGNIMRGRNIAPNAKARADADRAGMIGTMVNAKILGMVLTTIGVPNRVIGGIKMDEVAEPFIVGRAIRHLEKGRIVIFGGGLGLPFFTTDTTAVHRGRDIHVDAVLMAKYGIDGVYNCDPRSNAKARRYRRVSYRDALKRGLQVMDATAVAMAEEDSTPVIVFGADSKTAMRDIVLGREVGTIISKKKSAFAT
jgi:uridylate kinase